MEPAEVLDSNLESLSEGYIGIHSDKTPEVEPSSENDESDLDDSIENLATKPSTSCKSNDTSEIVDIVVSSSDEESPASSFSSPTKTRYQLRKRKSKVNYAAPSMDGDGVNFEHESSKRLRSDTLNITTMTSSQLKRFLKNSSLIEERTKWTVFLQNVKVDNEALILEFISQYGEVVDSLSIFEHYPSKDFTLLRALFAKAKFMTKLSFEYQKSGSVFETNSTLIAIFKLISSFFNDGNLGSLKSIKVVGLSNLGVLNKEEFCSIVNCGPKLSDIQLGSALWEDIKPDIFESFLEKHKDVLESIFIHGGYRGVSDKSRYVINFPTRIPNLKSLIICPKYEFAVTTANPRSKKSRVVRLDKDIEEAFRVAINLPGDYPNLRKIHIGNLIDLEQFGLSLLRKVEVFRCGSYWNLSVRFPPEESRQSKMICGIEEIQFPDALKDPFLIKQLSSFIPRVKKVWLYLPSVDVLSEFFKAFRNSEVEFLRLKLQFDFPNVLDRCLFPHLSLPALDISSQEVIKTLQEYKHWQRYVRTRNIELPKSEDCNCNSNGGFCGISGLKRLKRLELIHVPRELLIPNPDDEREWYDHNFKYLDTKFGYNAYPLSKKCYNKLLDLNLTGFYWENIVMRQQAVTENYGYVHTAGSEWHVHSSSDEDDNLFAPIPKGGPPKVEITNAMIEPDYFKNKSEPTV